MNETQTQAAIAASIKKRGNSNTSILLSALGRDKQFLNALESSVGKELMADAVAQIEDKVHLILAEKDTPKDRAELQAYLSITRKWQARIERYNTNKAEFEKGAN
jgi:hypothetical protein